MSVLGTVMEILERSSPDGGGEGPVSSGAYWCTDCGERIRDVDVEGEGPPSCPGCGEAMAFERSMGTGDCAC